MIAFGCSSVKFMIVAFLSILCNPLFFYLVFYMKENLEIVVKLVTGIKMTHANSRIKVYREKDIGGSITVFTGLCFIICTHCQGTDKHRWLNH